MVERVTTGDNLGTICAGHLIWGNVLLVGIALSDLFQKADVDRSTAI
jgi:hypothetical protein